MTLADTKVKNVISIRSVGQQTGAGLSRFGREGRVEGLHPRLSVWRSGLSFEEDTVSDMEISRAVQIRSWLPYWAVLQADVRQTMRSWVYRLWVAAAALFAVGYFLYRLGVYKEAGMIQDASKLMSDMLRWSVYGSATLIIVLTAGCISSERGTLADSVLSRGISRFQYFLGKWHSRLATVLGTYLVLGFCDRGPLFAARTCR